MPNCRTTCKVRKNKRKKKGEQVSSYPLGNNRKETKKRRNGKIIVIRSVQRIVDRDGCQVIDHKEGIVIGTTSNNTIIRRPGYMVKPRHTDYKANMKKKED